jgi:hypothetical protein
MSGFNLFPRTQVLKMIIQNKKLLAAKTVVQVLLVLIAIYFFISEEFLFTRQRQNLIEVGHTSGSERVTGPNDLIWDQSDVQHVANNRQSLFLETNTTLIIQNLKQEQTKKGCKKSSDCTSSAEFCLNKICQVKKWVPKDSNSKTQLINKLSRNFYIWLKPFSRCQGLSQSVVNKIKPYPQDGYNTYLLLDIFSKMGMTKMQDGLLMIHVDTEMYFGGMFCFERPSFDFDQMDLKYSFD